MLLKLAVYVPRGYCDSQDLKEFAHVLRHWVGKQLVSSAFFWHRVWFLVRLFKQDAVEAGGL
jgi:hypothetical protein